MESSVEGPAVPERVGLLWEDAAALRGGWRRKSGGGLFSAADPEVRRPPGLSGHNGPHAGGRARESAGGQAADSGGGLHSGRERGDRPHVRGEVQAERRDRPAAAVRVRAERQERLHLRGLPPEGNGAGVHEAHKRRHEEVLQGVPVPRTRAQAPEESRPARLHRPQEGNRSAPDGRRKEHRAANRHLQNTPGKRNRRNEAGSLPRSAGIHNQKHVPPTQNRLRNFHRKN